MTGPCSGCGSPLPGGSAACQALFNGRLERESSDFRYARWHRVVVDCYCLQHPDQYCASAKSLMAHLCGLCIALEHSGDQRAYRALQLSLDGNPRLEKAPVPVSRGHLTVADVLVASEPTAYEMAVNAWAHCVWDAYVPIHDDARAWIRESAFSRFR